MRTTSRAARIEVRYARDDLIAMLEHALPFAGERVQQILYFALPCLLWGLVIYAAASFALT